MLKRSFVISIMLLLLALMPLAVASAAEDTQTCQFTHTVQAGDNLFRIALQYDLTADQLAAQNGILNSAYLYIGQVLTINTCGGTASTGTSGGASRSYTIQAGDNLFRIALVNGLSVNQLAAFNGITNPTAIQIGQVIQIPTSGSSTPVVNTERTAPTQSLSSYEARISRISYKGRYPCAVFTNYAWGTHYIDPSTFPGCASVPVERLTVACYDPAAAPRVGSTQGWRTDIVPGVSVNTDEVTGKQNLLVAIQFNEGVCGIFRK